MKKKIFAHLRRWHRRLGISAALFILLLSISGIILNHSDQLELPHSFVESKFLQSIYGLKDPKNIKAFEVNDALLIATDEQLWLDNQLILKDAGKLISAVDFNGVIVAVIDEQLLLLSANGEIIEKMDSNAGIPQNITHLASKLNGTLSADKIWIKTSSKWYVSNEQLLQWQLVETELTPDWVNPVELSNQQLFQARKNFLGQLISWEKLLLDFHSGRIFGMAGPLFSDLVALLLILLSGSGIAMWVRNARKRKVNNNSNQDTV